MRLRAVEEALGAGRRTRSPDRPRDRVALVAALPAGRSGVVTERWLRHFRFGKEYAEPAIALAERGARVLAQLQDRRGMRDSRLYRLLSRCPRRRS